MSNDTDLTPTPFQTPASLMAQGTTGHYSWYHLLTHERQDVGRLLVACKERSCHVLVGPPAADLELPAVPSGAAIKELLFLDLRATKGLIEHMPSDQVVSIETGATLAAVDAYLQEHKQWLPLSGDPNSTICDVILSGDGGSLEFGYGGVRHVVLGLEVALANGRQIKTGGKVVKNVTGYDLTRLFIGSRGRLGVPLIAHLRLYARPEAGACILAFAADARRLLDYGCRLIGSGMPIAALELMDVTTAFQLLGAERAKQLESILVSDSVPKAVLYIRLIEQRSVLEEILPTITSLAESDILCLDSSENTAQLLLDGLSRRPQRFVEISFSHSQLGKLLAQLPSARFQYRFGSARLRFPTESLQDAEQLMGWMESWALRANIVTAASIEQPPYYSIHKQLPTPDPAVVALKNGLLAKFDGRSIFNPFAFV